MSGPVAVTGWSLHVPGVRLGAAFPALACPAGRLDGAPACPPAAAHELLGRKGLLGKDPATRLALCAVHRALGLAPGAGRAGGQPDPRTAVVVSSNLGNLATVGGIVRRVRAGRPKEISPLDAPGASSNVIASAVAIWFGCGGPNLTICSGAPSGILAVEAGMLLVRAGRADRVIVAGAEPADEMAAALCAGRVPALREGAACVILEPVSAAPGAPVLGPARPSRPGTAGRATIVAGGGPPAVGTRSGTARTPTVDIATRCGDLYGAAGVAATAVAAAAVAAGELPGKVTIVCGDDLDGWRSLGIRPSRKAAGNGEDAKGEAVNKHLIDS